MFFAEDYGGVPRDGAESFVGACMAAGQLVMLFITIPLGKFIDGVSNIWSVVYFVCISASLCIAAFGLIPFLPASYRPIAAGVDVLILSLDIQLYMLVLIPVFIDLANAGDKVQRDITIFQPLQSALGGTLVPAAGMLVTSFGNTGDVMSGNRLKYTLLGYESFYWLAAVLGLTAAVLYRSSRALKIAPATIIMQC
jgi:hypothetical protein